jgi:hypothetical protein
VYFIVAALSRSSEGAVVDVSLDSEQEHVVIDVRTSEPVLLGEVEDRVGALGGRMDIDGTPDGGMAVHVEVACA